MPTRLIVDSSFTGFEGKQPLIVKPCESLVDLSPQSSSSRSDLHTARATTATGTGGGIRRKLSLRRSSSFRGFRRAGRPERTAPLLPAVEETKRSPAAAHHPARLSSGLPASRVSGLGARVSESTCPTSTSSSSASSSRNSTDGILTGGYPGCRQTGSDSKDTSNDYAIKRDDDLEIGYSRSRSVSSFGSVGETKPGVFVRSVAGRCSERVRSGSAGYRGQINKQLRRIPSHLLKNIFTSATAASRVRSTCAGSADTDQATICRFVNIKPVIRRVDIPRGAVSSAAGAETMSDKPADPALSSPNETDGGALSFMSKVTDDDVSSIGSGERREKWQMVINEVISTEQAYVEALDGVITGYIKAVGPYATALQITPSDLEVLFCNITKLYELNSSLLDDLVKCENEPVALCACFVKRKESFNHYTEYCTNFPRSVAKLESMLKREGSPAAEFFKGCQRRVKHTLPLGSQLIKPVQRILKYHLLMRELVKNCKDSFSDSELATVQDACEVMQGVASHINEMKRQNEKALYIQELQSRLVDWEGDELASYGDILKEGVLRHPKKLFGFTERKVYLFETLFLITKERDGDLLVKPSYQVGDLGVVDLDESGVAFRLSQLSQISKTTTLHAQTDEEKKKWIEVLRRTIVASDSRLSEETKKQLLAAICKETKETRSKPTLKRFSSERMSSPDPKASSTVVGGSVSPRWRRATVSSAPDDDLGKVKEVCSAVETEGTSSAPAMPLDVKLSPLPPRPPQPTWLKPPTSPSDSISSTATSPGLRDRFSRLFSREATVGEDCTDGGLQEKPSHNAGKGSSSPELPSATHNQTLETDTTQPEAKKTRQRPSLYFPMMASFVLLCSVIVFLQTGADPVVLAVATGAILAGVFLTSSSSKHTHEHQHKLKWSPVKSAASLLSNLL
eukprot:scpid23127/ scgid3757/ Pleckstrin homology domain-containing family G member 1